MPADCFLKKVNQNYRIQSAAHGNGNAFIGPPKASVGNSTANHMPETAGRAQLDSPAESATISGQESAGVPSVIALFRLSIPHLRHR